MELTDTRSRRSSSPRRRLGLVAAGTIAALLASGGGWAAAFLTRAAPLQTPASPLPAPTPQDPGAPPPQLIITGGAAQRFAVPDCIPRKGDEASREACRTITQVLRNDLRFEFSEAQFVPESLFAAIPAMNPDAPNFEDWRGIGAEVLVITRAEVTGGEMTVELKVHFVGSGQVMLAKRYSGKADNPRIFSHQASDDIMTLTPYQGVARSKIAFVSDRDGGKGQVTKELYIMDYDGHNPRRVTVNRSMNILPNWSPDGRSLAYVSYRQGAPEVFVAHIYEGRSSNVTGGKGGQSFAPAFSPDGKRIAFASSRSGNMEIWVANADGSGTKKITSSAASDTAPFWSPTGLEIAFTSDRGGTPQIYVMDAEGLNVRRLTTVGNWNDAPAWNPSKQWSEIAYTSRLEGRFFQIAVVDLATRQVRQITEGRGSCEYPSWARNGRHLTFACSRRGTWQVHVSDREGRSVQALPAGGGNNVMPDWGP